MLIAMAVFDTESNNRTWMTEATLQSLAETVDFTRHRLFISDNGSHQPTLDLYPQFPFIEKVIYNQSNLGTAKAINKAWLNRNPDEHALKMDNDVTFCQSHWADWMEDAFSRDTSLGILGLKRNDLDESPHNSDPSFKSALRMLPHSRGQRWITIEEVRHVMGTCQAYSSRLLDTMGYLVQPSLYGFDDSLSSVRAEVLGYSRAFLVGFEIAHIDPGASEFTDWKINQANEHFDAYKWMAAQYQMGIKDVYENENA